MTILYNCHHDGDQYRITKFNDGAVESTYLCTTTECECPAGAHPTCRHRQMLPLMINLALPNRPWFLDWDGGKRVVDFNGHDIPPVPNALLDDLPMIPIPAPNLPPTAVQTVEAVKSWRRV